MKSLIPSPRNSQAGRKKGGPVPFRQELHWTALQNNPRARPSHEWVTWLSNQNRVYQWTFHVDRDRT